MDDAEVRRIAAMIPVPHLRERPSTEIRLLVQQVGQLFGYSVTVTDAGVLYGDDGIVEADQPLMHLIWDLVLRRFGPQESGPEEADGLPEAP